MKYFPISAIKKGLALIVTAFWSLVVMAQDDKIVIDKSQAESWVMRNWIWLAVGGLVLLVIIFSGSSARRRKTTTVTRDSDGHIRKVTTTEVDD
ncbi:MAG: hypothetical protein EOO09_15585 [Chitinophagaceae bacterium]|nr:MAG: hypothetical protein EOO09_15585 [Chitinophagaceae bacterium]